MKITIQKEDVTKYLGGISFTTTEETNGETMEFSSLQLYDVGSQVKVTDEDKCQFLGTIVSVEEGMRPPHSYKAMDFSYVLKGDTEIIQLKKIRADDAIRKVCKRAGVTCSVCKIPTQIKKIYKASALAIIKDILKKAEADQGKDYFLEVRGTKLVVEQKKKIKISPTFLVADNAAITHSIESLKNKVKVVKGNKTLATAKSSASIKKLGTLGKVVTVSKKTSKAKAQSEAKTQLKKLNKIKSEKSLTLLVTAGAWDVRKCRLIKIKSGGLNGWYSIKSCTHSIEGNRHTCEVEVAWSGQFK